MGIDSFQPGTPKAVQQMRPPTQTYPWDWAEMSLYPDRHESETQLGAISAQPSSKQHKFSHGFFLLISQSLISYVNRKSELIVFPSYFFCNAVTTSSPQSVNMHFMVFSSVCEWLIFQFSVSCRHWDAFLKMRAYELVMPRPYQRQYVSHVKLWKPVKFEHYPGKTN